MGRPREPSSEFSSRALKVKKHRAAPCRRSTIDEKLERRGERRIMRLPRVPEEEEANCEEDEEAERARGHHVKRGRWAIRMRRGKLVTPVFRYLQRFRRSCSAMAAIAAAPFRCYKLGVLLAKLHLSRKRSSRRIHSLLSPFSPPSDEHAPLLPLCETQV